MYPSYWFTSNTFNIAFLVDFITDFGVPSEIRAQAVHPNCLHVTWKKAEGHVTGYRVYCFTADSAEAKIIKDIHDKDTEYVVVSGLNHKTQYRVGVGSISTDIESNTVFMEDNVEMRKCCCLSLLI